jgi:chemotaxis receptor (MCP) glutamine deamidase CheD
MPDPAGPARPGHGHFTLNPGEVIFSRKPCHIRTILGSCVGVALYDPRLRIGGMCHYLLAAGPEGERSTRYGSIAIPALVEQFLNAGSRAEDLQAHVAGGSLMLHLSEVFFVGANNIKQADRILGELGVRVLAREVGGIRGRRMFMQSDSGEVRIEFIPQFDPDMKKVL